MANKKDTNVILTSYPVDGWTPTKLKLNKLTDKQKQEFVNHIKGYLPPEGLISNNCAFNVHYDSSLIHCCSSNTPHEFTPHNSRNKPNELIIEVITDEENRECWPVCPTVCPLCIKDGQCTSPFVQKYIGEILFPNKYKKER